MTMEVAASRIRVSEAEVAVHDVDLALVHDDDPFVLRARIGLVARQRRNPDL
jgi:hypothetical protein